MAAQTRPPIVAFMGHVDHGKTTLVSQIKAADLTRREPGGISQHLGAYQIVHQRKKIVLIDTPGHVAFAKMRSRGAMVADLAVLVVAADEGVKSQTLESLKHIQKAKIPFLVAINKIDLPNINLEKVKKDLVKNKVPLEKHGGDIVAVLVSAKTGQGVDQLLEMILLLAQMAELKADLKGQLEAVVIESCLDQGKGPVATVLIRNGTLKVGESVRVETVAAKIKAMFDQEGCRLDQTQLSQPVEVLGFEKVPPVGGRLEPITNEPLLGVAKSLKERTLPAEEKLGPKIIFKADTVGTLEAVVNSLPQEIVVIQSGVGEINQSDVLLASTTGAEIVGFNVKVREPVSQMAQTEGVEIKTYQVIYELLEAVEKKVIKILEPTIDEEILGQAEIIAEFTVKGERVAGAKVKEGHISKNDRLHLKRDQEILGDVQIKSMKIKQNDVEKTKLGQEFGVVLSGKLDFRIGDVLVSYTLPTKKA